MERSWIDAKSESLPGRSKLTVCFRLRLTETRAILRRQGKRPHHLCLERIASVEVQLSKPEDEARSIRITPQVADVFHAHKQSPLLLIDEGLSVGSRKLHVVDYHCSVHYLPQDAGS